MERGNSGARSKGGRPKKQIKKDQLMAIKCSLEERKIIECRAVNASLTVSEYLRQLGLNGKIDRREIALPKEILMLSATLNHIAANLNQIAKKRNSMDDLTALERSELFIRSKDLKAIALQIKTCL